MTPRLFKWAIIALIAVWIFIPPILTLQKIGISWDEPNQRYYGNVLWNTYRTGETAPINQNTERYYGPLAPLILSAPEFLKTGNSDLYAPPYDTQMAIYDTRHLINWFIFVIGLFCFFKLCQSCSISTEIALLGTLSLATTPIIAGHALFNSKDIPFMVALIGVLWASFAMTRRTNLVTIGWLGVSVAIAILCRINALSVIGLVWMLITIALPNRIATLKGFTASALISVGLVFIGWPTLWDQPISAFCDAWVRMANYPWTETVLFDGGLISAQSLPWTYIPVWMGLTLSPILITLAGCVVISGLWMTAQRKWKISQSGVEVGIVLASGISPIIGIWITNPTLYDGWRHLFFVYPPILLAILYGIDKWQTHLKFGALSLIIGHGIWSWVLYFPFPHCYMNAFAGNREAMMYHWETDYWGTTYRQLIEALPRDAVIVPDNEPARATAFALGRTVSLQPTSNGIFVTNHRWRQGPLALPIVQSVIKDGIVLSTAYRLPPLLPSR